MGRLSELLLRTNRSPSEEQELQQRLDTLELMVSRTGAFFNSAQMVINDPVLFMQDVNIRHGELRLGNGMRPGSGFSGVRIGYPGFTYSSETWNLAGVQNDVLQVGIRSSDGKLLAGGGVARIDELGMSVWGSTGAVARNVQFNAGSSAADGVGTTALSWTHNVASTGAYNSIFVAFAATSQASVENIAVSVGGSTASRVNYSTMYGMLSAVYHLESPPAGSQTVTISGLDAGTRIAAGAMDFLNVTQLVDVSKVTTSSGGSVITYLPASESTNYMRLSFFMAASTASSVASSNVTDAFEVENGNYYSIIGSYRQIVNSTGDQFSYSVSPASPLHTSYIYLQPVWKPGNQPTARFNLDGSVVFGRDVSNPAYQGFKWYRDASNYEISESLNIARDALQIGELNTNHVMISPGPTGTQFYLQMHPGELNSAGKTKLQIRRGIYDHRFEILSERVQDSGPSQFRIFSLSTTSTGSTNRTALLELLADSSDGNQYIHIKNNAEQVYLSAGELSWEHIVEINRDMNMFDFRVRTSTYAEMFHINSSQNAVQIGTNVAGSIADFRASSISIFGGKIIFDSTGFIDFAELGTSPAAPASSWGRLYTKTDGKIYFQNDGGTEYDLTGGGGDWTLIADVKLASTAASIDFSSIPNTYKHLVIIGSLKSAAAAAADSLRVRFNGSTDVIYDALKINIEHPDTLITYETLGSSSMNVGAISGSSSVSANEFSVVELIIPDYLDGSKYQGVINNNMLIRGAATGDLALRSGFGTWKSTAAITQITLFADGGDFVAGSRATLYGLG